MVSVASLLNPVTNFSRDAEDYSPSPARKILQLTPAPVDPAQETKVSKPTATRVKGQAKGEVKYPPYESVDDELAAAYEQFKVQPIGHISDYPKRIPYSSEKKTFHLKTGRNGFEVYQYTFKMPRDESGKEAYSVMWDYNVGLVRITALFKSLKHSKTMPAKVMNANPGLKDICHSITGGSISAQGYWVPFEAAKAIAARFCHEIRFVLVPMFGRDFVSMCTEVGDDSHQQYSIDPTIIQKCVNGASTLCTQSRESSAAVSPQASATFAHLPVWPPKKTLNPKSAKMIDDESGYGTDSERSEWYPSSPGSGGNIEWTPVNSPVAKKLAHYRSSARKDVTSSPRETGSLPLASLDAAKKQRSPAKRVLNQFDAYIDEDCPSDLSVMSGPPLPKRRKISAPMTAEMAAHTLLELRKVVMINVEEEPVKRRRASA